MTLLASIEENKSKNQYEPEKTVKNMKKSSIAHGRHINTSNKTIVQNGFTDEKNTAYQRRRIIVMLQKG